MIYLYRKKSLELNRRIMMAIVVGAIIVYYVIGEKPFTWLMITAVFLTYTSIVKGGVLENKITIFFSKISMEMYLSHRMIFRIVEKLGINYIFGTGWGQYIVTVTIVLFGTALFAVVMKKVFKEVEGLYKLYIG